jgi:hypothetical protein
VLLNTLFKFAIVVSIGGLPGWRAGVSLAAAALAIVAGYWWAGGLQLISA